jgi:hypothetical protein
LNQVVEFLLKKYNLEMPVPEDIRDGMYAQMHRSYAVILKRLGDGIF